MNNKLLLRIRGLASQEYTVEQIAKKLNISFGEAEYYVVEIGYRPRYDDGLTAGKLRYQPEHGVPPVIPDMVNMESGDKTWRLTSKDIQRIKEYREQGFNVTDIALKVGKHRDTVRNALKRMKNGEGA